MYKPWRLHVGFFFDLKSSQMSLSGSFENLFAPTARINIFFFQCGDRLYTSESAVYRRQILTYKDDPRTERVKEEMQKDHKSGNVFFFLKSTPSSSLKHQ